MDSVDELTRRHLHRLDAAAPGLIEALYLTGSVVLDDHRPGVSDVDFLAVTSRPLGEVDLDLLTAFHAGMPDSPKYDGIYLDRTAFAALPDDGRAVPHAVDGVFRRAEPCGELVPPLWLTLERYGVAVRGPKPAELGLRLDRSRQRQWNLENLRSYWQGLAEQALRVRNGEQLEFVSADGLAAADVVDAIVADAAARWAEPPYR